MTRARPLTSRNGQAVRGSLVASGRRMFLRFLTVGVRCYQCVRWSRLGIVRSQNMRCTPLAALEEKLLQEFGAFGCEHSFDNLDAVVEQFGVGDGKFAADATEA